MITIDMKHKPLVQKFVDVMEAGELPQIFFDPDFHVNEDGTKVGLWVLKSEELDPEDISKGVWTAIHFMMVETWRDNGMLEEDGIDDLAIGLCGPDDDNTATFYWNDHVSQLTFMKSQDVNADFEKLTSLPGVEVDAQGNHSVPAESFKRSPLALAMMPETSDTVF
jgi:hypothetical protein